MPSIVRCPFSVSAQPPPPCAGSRHVPLHPPAVAGCSHYSHRVPVEPVPTAHSPLSQPDRRFDLRLLPTIELHPLYGAGPALEPVVPTRCRTREPVPDPT